MARDDFRDTLIAGVVSFAFIVTIMWVFGFQFQVDTLLFMFVGFVALAFYAQRSGELTTGFVIITIGLLLVLAEYLIPNVVTDPIFFAIDQVLAVVGLGGMIFQLEAWEFFVVSVFFTFLMLMAKFRLTGEKKFAVPLLDRTLAEFARYTGVYLNAARLFVLFFLAFVFLVFQQAGQVAGSVGDVVNEVPFIASNILTALLGYLSLGGSLPIVGDVPMFAGVGAGLFAIIAIGLIAWAASQRFEPSGPLSRFLRR